MNSFLMFERCARHQPECSVGWIISMPPDIYHYRQVGFHRIWGDGFGGGSLPAIAVKEDVYPRPLPA